MTTMLANHKLNGSSNSNSDSSLDMASMMKPMMSIMMIAVMASILPALAPKTIPISAQGNSVALSFTPVLSGGGSGALSISNNASVVEGQQTVMTVTVTNTSTFNGVAIADMFVTKASVATDDGTPVLALTTERDSIVANGNIVYTYTLTAPLGKSGQNLIGAAVVSNTQGAQLAIAAGTEPISAAASTTIGTILSEKAFWTNPATGAGVPDLFLSNGITILAGIVLFYIDWQNNSIISGTPITGHLKLTVDGVVIPPYMLNDTTVSPGGHQIVIFANTFTAGTHTIVTTLYNGSETGAVLDTKTYTINAAAIVSGATIAISQVGGKGIDISSIMNLMITMMIVVMMMKMMTSSMKQLT